MGSTELCLGDEGSTTLGPLRRSRRRRRGIFLEEHSRRALETHAQNKLGEPLRQVVASCGRHRRESLGQTYLGGFRSEPHDFSTARRETNFGSTRVVRGRGALHELALDEAANDD